MRKRLFCLLLVLAALLGCGAPAAAEEAAPAIENQFEIYVDGKRVDNSYSILENGVTYVAVYNVASALCPGTTADWGGGKSQLTLTGEGYTLTAQVGRCYITCNGRCLYAADQARLHPQDGSFLLPVRLVAKALGAGVDWDPEGVYLTAGQAPLESGDSFYDADDLFLLARTIRHEAGYEPFEGQIAVGNAVLNRVRSASFPNSVRGVIYQKGQFSSSEGATPTAQNYAAAKLALEGVEMVPASCCWFNTAGKSFWGSRYKSLVRVIGSQAFYG